MWVLIAIACQRSGSGKLAVTGAPSPYVPAVLNVTVDGPPGEAFVEYGLDALDQVTPTDPRAERHDLAVIGLKAGRSYQWRAVVVDEDGDRHESEIGAFDVPSAPALLQLPDLHVAVDDPSSEFDFAFVNVVRTLSGTAFAAILDRDGDWVWWVDSGGDLITTPKRSLDGRSLLWNQYDFKEREVDGAIVRVSLDGRARTETVAPYTHHDFLERDDGTIAFLSMTFASFDFPGASATLGSDQISVVDEGGTDPTPIFSMFDDFPLEPVFTCDHMKPTSGPDELFGTTAYEWTHSNSLMYLPDLDSYFVLQKYSDWLIRIDAASGDVMWWLNGRETPFSDPGSGDPVWTSVSDTTLWSHGHMSETWDGGGLVFDNGDHHPSSVSRAVEFAYDEASRTAEIVWEFPHPGGAQTAVMGDVRLLPNDHRLVTWSELGSMTEVTRAGDIVWEVDWTRGQPLSAIIGRVVPLSDLYAPTPASR